MLSECWNKCWNHSIESSNRANRQNFWRRLNHLPKAVLKTPQRRFSLVTVPKLGISQSEALFTVMIFYDIKSLTWYPAISWTVSKTHTFLQTLEMKITTEIQRNAKLLHLLNESYFLTLTKKKKFNFAAKLDAATMTGARVYVYGQRSNFFTSKWSRIFQISLLIWNSKIPKMKLQTKEL